MKTNTRIDSLVPWSPDFHTRSPLFAPIKSLAEYFRGFSQWPEPSDYQQLLNQHEPIHTRHGAALKVVPQEGKPGRFEHHYAPRIYFSGEIQTRSRNWHDFFQLLTWLLFPNTKATINSIHIPLAKARIEAGAELGRRSPIENMLSLFDEGGAVIISSDNRLLQLIREFRWKELFWTHRNELNDKLDCITFGHAMYEKALAPYLGMTANAILIDTDDSYFSLDQTNRLSWLDSHLTTLFDQDSIFTAPRDLQPFPILGMPGWDPANCEASYYDNSDYFRPGRNRKV